MNEWHPRQISDLAVFHRGITWASSQETDRPEPGCVPVLRIPNVQDRLDTSSIIYLRHISSEQRIRFAATRDWLLMVGSNGNPNRVGDSVRITEDTDYLFASFLVGVEPKRDFSDPCFLQYLMRAESVRKAIADSIKGTTGLRNISLTYLAAHVLPCPALPEQRKIARILTTLDNLIEKTEALIAKYQAVKQGMMHDLFTRGIDAHGHLRPPHSEAPDLYKQSELGWIPKEWNAKSLGLALKDAGGFLQTGPFGSQLHAHEYVDEGVPVVMPQDIIDGRILTEDIARITSLKASSLARHRLQANDVLFSRRGELSRAAPISVTERDWICGTGCFLLRCPGNRINARWLARQYRLPLIQRQVEARAVGSTMPSLNNSVMEKLTFLFPHPDEQTAIEERIHAQDALCLNLAIELDKLRVTKAGLMQDLLTGKVRVKVDDAQEVGTDA